MKSVRYAIITPVRNEQEFLPGTIASVVSQTVLPLEWVIVNDGSNDRTGKIIEAAAARHCWIRPWHRGDRGFRKSGGGVMETFRDGLRQLQAGDWDFLVKLDGDLTFGADYFKRCFGRFDANPKLGIGGGLVCNEVAGRTILDSTDDPKFHVRGATKIYRRACWDAIGGLIETTGWDTMDEVKANMLGWKTGTFPELPLIHHRKTGEADGCWRNWFKNGRANYIVGYHPLFMLGKCVRRAFRRPYGIASLALGCGFVTGYFSRTTRRTTDRNLIQYLQGEQLRALVGKKCLWKAYEA